MRNSKTVVLKGKAYPVIFGINEMLKFLKTLDIDITNEKLVKETILNLSGENSIKMALIALEAGSLSRNTECNINKKLLEQIIILDPIGFKNLLNTIDELATQAAKGNLN